MHDGVQVLLPGGAHAAVLWLQLRGHGQALGLFREAPQQAGLHRPQPGPSRTEQELQGLLG